MSIELDPVARITADAVGEPGQRVFFLQARSKDVVVSLLVEKQQVAVLAQHIDALLARLDAEGKPTQPDEDDDGLEAPIEPEFRVGSMAIGYDAERDLVLLECEEFVPQADDDDDEDEEEDAGSSGTTETPDGATVRLWATRGQMAALARRGAAVVAAGRPTCSMCGQPLEAEGHFCPPSNGHREIGELS